MSEADDESVTERPATWENVVVGKGEELIGKLTGDKAMAEEGEDWAETAQEVREEYREDKDSPR